MQNAKCKIKVTIESVILSVVEPSQSLCDSCLAAARSQNGSGIINAIHYRSAVSLPEGRASPLTADAELS